MQAASAQKASFHQTMASSVCLFLKAAGIKVQLFDNNISVLSSWNYSSVSILYTKYVKKE